MMAQGRIIKRLLGQPATNASSDANLTFEPQADYPFLRPNTSQTASYSLGAALNSLDRSPGGTFAVVAGEKAFKILKVDGATISEEHDLRAAVSAQSHVHNDTLSAFNDRLNIKTVNWAHGELDTHIITASANGRITLYDVNHINSGLEVGQIREHARQVHKLAINPVQPKLILSSSQDGTARLFDLRAPTGRGEQLYHSRAMFRCNADAVRDIKWTPAGPESVFHFACSTASGTIQYWDTRKQSAPIIKINAHDSACLSISWHPDGKHLISGGFDQRCHVWDLSGSAGKRQKPKYSFSTPAPVSIVSWRPACWSSTAKAKRAAQVAVVYDDTSAVKTQVPSVHIWDLARPTIPFREIAEFNTSPTGLRWHERDSLWTVGREGLFTQTDVAFAPIVVERRSLSTFDFSPSGDVLMLLEERKSRHRSLLSAPSETPIHDGKGESRSQSQSPGGGLLGLGRSDSDDDAVGSFLGTTPALGEEIRRHTGKSASVLSTTPPSSNSQSDKNVLDLEDGVEITGLYKPRQVMAIGHAPSTVQSGVYQYLSNRYMQRISRDIREGPDTKPGGLTLADRITSILNHFARSAEMVGHFRLCQTWKIMAYTMGLLLRRRAQYHRDMRISRIEESKMFPHGKQELRASNTTLHLEEHSLEEGASRKIPRSRSPLGTLLPPSSISVIAEEMESTSNVNTPLARPVHDSQISVEGATRQVALVEEDELRLPSAAHISENEAETSPEQSSIVDDPEASLGGYDFYGTASMTTPAIDIAIPPLKKAPLRLDLPITDQPAGSISADLTRRDSMESFQMFSTSNESHRARFPSSSEIGDHGSLPLESKTSAIETESSWDSSTASGSRANHSFDSIAGNDPRHDERDTLKPVVPQSLRIEGDLESSDFENGFDPNAIDLSSSTHTLTEAEADSTNILYKDHLPRTSEPSFMPGPIDPHLLIPRTLQFELQSGSLNAAAMILLLKPLLTPGTLDDIQAAAILRQYHHRLTGMMLFTEAAHLRKLSYPAYRSTYSQGLHDIVIAYTCRTCKSPMGVGKVEAGVRLERCRKCKTYIDDCAVCNEREPALEQMDEDVCTNANLWWWCQGCGHGGHTSCMKMWHAIENDDLDPVTDGCCPLSGCLHPCLPGKWREEWIRKKRSDAIRARDEEMYRNVRQSSKAIRSSSVKVRRDDREIGESRAVETARGNLAGGLGLDKKKSVKVVAPGEE